jgi:3-deoxy-D-manno-octulosonic-acid transferase
MLRGLEDRKRFFERFGFSKRHRPEGKLIWFNAVSMGELNSAWTIVDRINRIENYNILITTTSITGSMTALKKIESLASPEKVIHQYTPIDFSSSVGRFLRHWKPNLLVSVESEFWPNIFTMTKKHCPVMVLNGKLSKRSFRLWYRFRKLKEKIFGSIDLCLAQSRNDHRKFLNLGVQNVQFLGNIKFFVGKTSVDTKLYEKLLEEVGIRPRWLANCTHEGEEKIIIDTHKKLRKSQPNLITFMVVRYVDKISGVIELLDANDIKYVTPGQTGPIEKDVEFYLYDRYGDLGTFFNFCNIVFMGGSLVDGIGGHNPAEAIKHNCCVITGPYRENNLMLFEELKNADGCIILKNSTVDELFSTVNFLLTNSAEVRRISRNAYVRSLQYNGILKEIVNIIIGKLL